MSVSAGISEKILMTVEVIVDVKEKFHPAMMTRLI
jgi:hypothetical protein